MLIQFHFGSLGCRILLNIYLDPSYCSSRILYRVNCEFPKSLLDIEVSQQIGQLFCADLCVFLNLIIITFRIWFVKLKLYFDIWSFWTFNGKPTHLRLFYVAVSYFPFYMFCNKMSFSSEIMEKLMEEQMIGAIFDFSNRPWDKRVNVYKDLILWSILAIYCFGIQGSLWEYQGCI